MKIPSKREKGCTRSERKEIESETAVEWRWQRGTEPVQEAGGEAQRHRPRQKTSEAEKRRKREKEISQQEPIESKGRKTKQPERERGGRVTGPEAEGLSPWAICH